MERAQEVTDRGQWRDGDAEYHRCSVKIAVDPAAPLDCDTNKSKYRRARARTHVHALTRWPLSSPSARGPSGNRSRQVPPERVSSDSQVRPPSSSTFPHFPPRPRRMRAGQHVPVCFCAPDGIQNGRRSSQGPPDVSAMQRRMQRIWRPRPPARAHKGTD